VRGRSGVGTRAGNEDGVGLVGLLATLIVLGLIAFIAVKATSSGGSGNGSNSASRALGGIEKDITGTTSAGTGGLIDQAGDVTSQTTLRGAEAIVAEAQTASGGYGTLTLSTLRGLAGNGAPFTSGASTNPGQISMASAGGVSGGVTLAVHSASGTCWFEWASSSTTLYGAQPNDPSCRAPALASAPALRAPASGTIGWSTGNFPQA
jgi:hypothetical protein